MIAANLDAGVYEGVDDVEEKDGKAEQVCIDDGGAPTITDVSKMFAARKNSRPNPGQLKIVSRTIEPNQRPMSESAKPVTIVGIVGRIM